VGIVASQQAANQQTFTNWGSSYDPYSNDAQTAALGPTPTFRNPKDARLAAWGSSPDTQYPDGYLGTLSANRRQDKVTNAIQRNNARPYTRGVHKGERINPGDYVWPDEFNPMTGLLLQSQGKKFAPTGAVNAHLTNGGKAGPKGVPGSLNRPKQEVINLQRQSMLKSLAPSWK